METNSHIHTNICMNCHQHYSGNYCPNCGQSAKVCRINQKMFFRWVASVYTCFNTKTGRTLKELVIHPGRLISQYIEGHRVPYMNPYQLLFFICAFISFFDLVDDTPPKDLNYVFHYKTNNDLIINIYNNFQHHITTQAYLDHLTSIFDYVVNNVTVFSMLTIPLAALGMRWAFYSRTPKACTYNYLEMTCARTYISSLIALCCLVLYFTPVSGYYMFYDPIISYYVYRQLYHDTFQYGEFSILLRTLLYILFYALGIAVLAAIIAVIILLIPVGVYVWDIYLA